MSGGPYRIGADASFQGGVAYWAAVRRDAGTVNVGGEAAAESSVDAEAVACIRALIRLAPGLKLGDMVFLHNDNEWVVKYVLNGQRLPREAKPTARRIAAARREQLLDAANRAQVVGVLVRGEEWYRQIDNAAHDRMRAAQPNLVTAAEIGRDPRLAGVQR